MRHDRPLANVVPASYSSFRAAVGDDTEDELTAAARTLLAGQPRRWDWRRAGVWVHLTPDRADARAQGWKLHISATSGSARDVLAAVLPVLLAEAVPLKFAATRAWVNWLNSPTTARESAGKFITVYPAEDTQAVRIAQACDLATSHLDGPAILSDRPVRPGSLVHYRYGAFQGRTVFDNDGNLVEVIHDPDGSPTPDLRRPWFAPAAWATDPFTGNGLTGDGSHGETNGQPRPPRAAPAKAVLLHGRYLVQQVLKHANKGGVYLAEDRATGDTVVLKEARPLVESLRPGADAVAALRHEARLLALLAPLGRTPKLLDEFEQQGHLFLVLERLEGRMLRDHAGRRLDETGTLPAAELRAMIRRLATLLATVHDAGVLLRDLTPNNLMVLPGGELKLVDLELAHVLGDGPVPDAPHGTPGYSSPEQMTGRPTGAPDDYCSLGAVIAYTATGANPATSPSPTGRPLPGRLRAWLAGVERDALVAERICDLVLGCMDERPDRRWGPREVLAAVDEPHRRPCPHEPARASTADLTRALEDIPRWLRRTRGQGGLLWPTSCSGLQMDPCNIQTGASGVGLFLCQLSRVGYQHEVKDLLAGAAAWVSEEVAAGPRRPPGLWFGVAGVSWFLAEAAGCLHDPALLQRAGELALSLPTGSFNPDLTHGTAGIGLAHLHHWSLTGDARFAERAHATAEALTAAAQSGADGVVWPVPGDVDSTFAGRTFYGFAHGNAGICHFLLCAAAALGEGAYRDLALEGLETLLRVARHGEGSVAWDSGPGRPYDGPHWCNGAAGVAATLVRAHTVTGDPRYRELAERAAETVMRTKWRGSLVHCHGLAGGGELLLDLYQATGEPRFRDQALELAAVIHSLRVDDDGLTAFLDETLLEVTASFNTGLTGIGAFLLRVVHGGARPLMLDHLLTAAAPAGRR